MIAGRGKLKGGRHEREINRVVSLWLSGGKRSDLLARNVLSGGAHTVARKRGETRWSPGDAMAAHPEGQAFLDLFHAEYKHWRQLKLDTFLWSEQGELYRTLKKLQKQCRDSGHHYFLVARQNHRPDLVFLPRDVGLDCCDPNKTHHILFSGTVYASRLDALTTCEPSDFLKRAAVWSKRLFTAAEGDSPPARLKRVRFLG